MSKSKYWTTPEGYMALRQRTQVPPVPEGWDPERWVSTRLLRMGRPNTRAVIEYELRRLRDAARRGDG